MKKKYIKKRYFLNPDDGVAAASARVNLEFRTSAGKHDKYPRCDLDASLSLSDCNRQITLDFDFWPSGTRSDGMASLKARRAKLQRLKQVVNEFVDAASAAYDEIEERMDEYVAAYAAAKAAEKEKKNKGKK